MATNSSSKTIRPLVVRFGALGDMVTITPLIRHLHARFGEPVDVLSSGGWTRPLLESQPGVGRLYLVGSRRWPYWLSREQQLLVDTLRERGPSATWIADDSMQVKTRWLLRRAGWSRLHDCDSHGFTDLPGPHMCDRYLRFAYRNPPVLGGTDLPLTATDAYGELQVSEERRAELRTWLASRGWDGRPLVLVQPGNKRTMRRGARQRSSNSKYWPEESWAQVLRGLRDRHAEHIILMMGVPQEAALNDDILALANVERAFNIANELPLPRLMALSERAFGVVSVDTGRAHVAAAVGGRVVALFGKSSPDMYAPRGRHARVACITAMHEGEQSMLGITPRAVLEAWDGLIRV